MKKSALLAAALLAGFAFAEDAAPVVPSPKASAVSPANGYELRGFFGAGANLEISVRAPGSESSRWLKVGKKSGDLLVEKADPKAGTATLLVAGRRHTLRLAGESAPVAVEETKPEAEPELSEADKARKARHARFREMRVNSTPEQQAEFGRVMREKMEAFRNEHPEMMNPANMNDPEKRKAMGEIFRANARAAAEAAAKLPGKDGKIVPVPEDFNRLMIEEGKDMETRGFGGGRGMRGGDKAPVVKTPTVESAPEPVVVPQEAGTK